MGNNPLKVWFPTLSKKIQRKGSPQPCTWHETVSLLGVTPVAMTPGYSLGLALFDVKFRVGPLPTS